MRDPSKFRLRFKEYKEGKSVREIYGLPGYEPGKLPVEEMMPYILAVENPTKQGLVNGVWRPPTDSTKWDVHAIGGGLDIREQHNPIVYNYLKTNGRLANPFLTAREEEVLREKVFKKTMLPALQNVYNKYGNKISSKGYARLAGMKWQGHPFLMAISPDSVTGKAFIKAIEFGDKDLDSVFDAYYKYPANAKRYAARILADTNYWKNHNTVATKPVSQEPIIAVQDATRIATIIPQEKTIPIADPRNATIAEALRAMWAHDAMNNIQGMAYDVPIWESKSLPALEPIELDTTPLKTYGDGKVSQGHKQIRQISSSVPAAGAGIYLAGNEEYKDGKLPGYEDGEISMGTKRNLTEEELNTALLNASHEQGMSGEDPLLSMLVGMKAVRLVGDLLAERRLKERAEMYKRWREANELTRGASRAWKMLDADRMARNWGYSDNPLGFLYDVFLDPIANMYTKIQKHPILGPLIPFNDGKLPGYSNGKIRIKPSKRGTFTAAAKKHGASVREFESRVLKNPEKYSKAMVRKALFSRNARSWKH